MRPLRKSPSLERWLQVTPSLSTLFLVFCTVPLIFSLITCAPNSGGSNIRHRGSFGNIPSNHYDQAASLDPTIEFKNAYKPLVEDVCSSLTKHAEDFDVFFREVLKVSHSNFHRMFSETYGILYDRHSSIFSDMFHDLELYYSNGSIDLRQEMKRFFSILYKKMFEELNAQFTFDANYLNCTVQHMEEMMPFGEEPEKLIVQIKRSFVAIRTFVHSLRYGSEILRRILEMPITNTCESSLRTICQSCSVTRSHSGVCVDSCRHIFEKSCFSLKSGYINLNRDWNQYLNDLIKLASRLKTSFNLELVLGPINIKISEYIMIFQENSNAISKRLFAKCGYPTMRKHDKRSAPYSYHNPTVSRFPLADHQTAMHGTSTNQIKHPINIDHPINDLTNNVKLWKNFWINLPSKLCSDYPHSSCSPNYTLRSGNDSPRTYSERNNYELLTQHGGTLKHLSSSLINAFNGLDVKVDNNYESGANVPIDDEIAGSGSGSGDDDKTLLDDEDYTTNEPEVTPPRVNQVEPIVPNSSDIVITSPAVEPNPVGSVPPPSGTTPLATPLTPIICFCLLFSLFKCDLLF